MRSVRVSVLAPALVRVIVLIADVLLMGWVFHMHQYGHRITIHHGGQFRKDRVQE